MPGRRQRSRSSSQTWRGNVGSDGAAPQAGAVPRRRNNSLHQDQPSNPLTRLTTAPPGGICHGTNPSYNAPHVGMAAQSSYYGQQPNLAMQPPYPGYPQNAPYPHYNSSYMNCAQQPMPPRGAYHPTSHRHPSSRPPSTSRADFSNNVAGMRRMQISSPADDAISITLSLEQYQKLSEGQAKSRQKRAEHDSGKTVWYNHLEGDVETPEICVFSIANACKFDEVGCKALHAKCPQHWQFRKNGRWYNFRGFHSKELEEAFQKADCDGARLSPLDPNKLLQGKSFSDLVQLLGDHAWTADFDKMIIEDRNDSLDIRRISTRSSVLSKSKMATVYEWYFKDEMDLWIKYGQPNTINKVDCIPNITSDEIETQFIKEKVPTFDFESERHEYTIDFSKMTQMNKQTKTSRPIRRRTKIRPIKGSFDTQKAVGSGSAPPYWTAMSNTAIFELIELKPSNTEFKRNLKLMQETLPGCVIVKMKRIQNPYLWNAYENKKKFIEKKLKSSNLNEKYLFHGTDATNVSSICEQNLDWRLHGSNVGQRFGRGAYFSGSARYSDKYTHTNTGSKTMLIVKVIIGTVTLGNSLMSRPPLNRATGHLFDTTVNDESTPKVFVKYDNQEYYPEYVVQYR